MTAIQISNTIITIGSVITALGIILGVPIAAIKARDKRREKERLQQEENKKQNEAINDIKDAISEVKEEQTLLCYAVTACLDGLHQQKCNGNVTDALNRMSKYLNTQAHK